MKKIRFIGLIVAISIVVFGCQASDVVANYGIKSWQELQLNMVDQVIINEQSITIMSPTDTEQFIYGDESKLHIDKAVFIEAGLDITKLTNEVRLIDEQLVIELTLSYSVNPTFEKLIRDNRDSLDYHPDHDIYELMLGGGNSLRWAKDIATNERDLVFVLNPEPFILAGLDPEKLEGWKYTKVQIMEHGKTKEVERLLKIYNIK